MKKSEVLTLLQVIQYPGFSRDIVSFGMVKNISLKGKETTALSFTVTRNIEGSFEVRLDRLFGSFSVTEAAPAPAPTETPPVDQSFNWWLIGSIIAGCIVAGLLGYFFIWRKRGLPLAKTSSAKAIFGIKKAVIVVLKK